MSLAIQRSGLGAWQVRFALRCLMVWWFVIFFPVQHVRCGEKKCSNHSVPRLLLQVSAWGWMFLSDFTVQSGLLILLHQVLAACWMNFWAFKRPLIYSLSLPVLWETLWGSQKVRQSLEMSLNTCPKIFAGIRSALLVSGPVQEVAVAACQPLQGP